jgi:hypothetical protein
MGQYASGDWVELVTTVPSVLVSISPDVSGLHQLTSASEMNSRWSLKPPFWSERP